MSKKYELIDALNAYCISDIDALYAYCISDEGNECNGCPFDNHKDGDVCTL